MSVPFAAKVSGTWDRDKSGAIVHPWHELPPPSECSPTLTLDMQLDAWRAETPPERRAQLDAEWAEGIRQSRADELERIRVRYGRGSVQFRRAAVRAAL
jgi:hypothetical protein